MTTVVKVQTSLNAPVGSRVLIYSEDHTIWHEDDVTPELRRFMAGRHKVYARARLEGTKVNLLHRVPDQGW